MQRSFARTVPGARRQAPAPARAAGSTTGRPPPQRAEPRPPPESRVGKVPIPVPAGTTVTLEQAYIKVKVGGIEGLEGWVAAAGAAARPPTRISLPLSPQGPKGELELKYPDLVEIKTVRVGRGSARIPGAAARRARRARTPAPHCRRPRPKSARAGVPPVPGGRERRGGPQPPPPRRGRRPPPQTPPSPPLSQLENGTLRVFKKEESRAANATHGLVRALASNMVVGTSVGFTKMLTMTGVGYRAAVTGSNLTLNLGFSHPIELPIPKGLEVKVEKATTLYITGADKCVVGQFCADVRKLRPPEPYKGKGIRYDGEIVRRKEGKRGK